MPTYKILTTNGRELATIANVLAPVVLTGVATDSVADKNRITVATTANVFPGMAISCPNIPFGSYIKSIVSSTVLELWNSVFDLTTGAWTNSAANAEAIATETGLTAHATGYHFAGIAMPLALGTWRNLPRSNVQFANQLVSTSGNSVVASPASYSVPGVITDAVVTTGASTVTSTPTFTPSDEAAATPLKRHNGELWGAWTFVSTGGLISTHPASNQYSVILSSVL